MPLSGTLFGIKTGTLYQLFKYAVYILILYNVVHFAVEDYTASAHRFRDGVSLADINNAFSQAIDSIFWLILLLMLELETWVIEDEDYGGLAKWSVQGVSIVCYVFIVLAFLGYLEKLLFVLAFEPVTLASACDGIGEYLSYVIEIDEYQTLTAANCAAVGGAPYYANLNDSILLSGDIHGETVLLAYTEVINAATWLLIVVVLWVDVYLQIRGQLTDRLYRINVWIKAVLYSILVVAAVIWGIYGNFIDFWDAFIWIVAFVFIELNLFQWHEEVEAKAESEAA